MHMSNPKGQAVSLKRSLALAILFIAVALCLAGSLKSRDAAQPLRVLFIGNSLTYSNDLPYMVEAFAEASGQKHIAVRAVVFGGYSLEDHWNQGEARRAISQGKWDVVVLQQGPSASTEGRRLLIEYARRFTPEIQRAGAKAALYMVWPSASRKQDFDGVTESYSRAAKDVEGLLFPVGEAWRVAWKRDPKLMLYSADGLHPTVAGSYLAALVIYEQLCGQSPVGLPAELKLRSGAGVSIPFEQARLLQEAAAEANKRFGRR